MIQILKLSKMSKEDILRRDTPENDVSTVVSEIIRRVREEGDAALRDYGARFDGKAPEVLEVSEEERKAALTKTAPEFLAILREAAENIEAYHRPCQRAMKSAGKMAQSSGERSRRLNGWGSIFPAGQQATPPRC